MSLLAELAKRDRCRSRYGGYYECNSNWYYWGRWVLAGIALVAFFIVLLSCCLIARRRRRRGTKPMYGTGWMAPPPKYGAHQNDYQLNSNAQGYNNQSWGGANYGNAPPSYGQTQPHQRSILGLPLILTKDITGTASIPTLVFRVRPTHTSQTDMCTRTRSREGPTVGSESDGAASGRQGVWVSKDQ